MNTEARYEAPACDCNEATCPECYPEDYQKFREAELDETGEKIWHVAYDLLDEKESLKYNLKQARSIIDHLQRGEKS